MGKRNVEENQDEIDLVAAKAAKKAKKAAAAALAAAAPEAEVEEEAAVALAAKKAAKKAKKAAAVASAEAEVEEEHDSEAAALAAKKAAKKAKKAAAAASGEAEMEEDPEAAALAAKKAAKKAKKAAAAASAEAEEADKSEKKDVTLAPKTDPVKAGAGEDEEWKDNTYKCCDCSQDWIDTADDQEFRWSKGFAETPKRCKDCRWAKKIRMEGGDPDAKGKGKGKAKDGSGNENTVFVRGLPFATTEDALYKDFAECGEIVSCRMPLNEEGSCKGIAFIKFTAKEGMDKAITFNETDYGGRMIYCTPAADKPKGKGKDGKDGKDGKGKGKGKDGKGKKGKKGKAPSESFAKSTGAMVASTGEKKTFDDSDDE